MNAALHIQHASRRLRRVFTVTLVAIPVLTALVWIFINGLPEGMQEVILPRYARLPLPVSARMLAFIASLLPASVAMYGTAVLIRLFGLYERGQIFRLDNVRCFRSLSRVLIGWCAVRIVAGPMMSVALTLHHPPGRRILWIGLGSPDITALLVGFVLGVIAWVMEEGRMLREERDYTV
ncbi:MAG: DUF2975 domain-containing protein [Deltaproteobacteria bacterium]|nr:DUF2975 domain-containing protein [Deltaproteobacteria bacterium]